MSERILEIRNLYKVYDNEVFKKKVFAVDDLNADFQTAQVSAILGHNGAGKTTTMRMILGLVRPNRGSILFRDRPISYRDRQIIGYMPEINRLPQLLTPEEVLKWHISCYPNVRSSKAFIDECLDRAGLTMHKKKKIKDLSKGLGRRVAWTLATSHDPELLILDEPLSGLDPVGRNQFSEWISEFKMSKKSIILCIHELDLVTKLCDQVYMIKQGKIIYDSKLDPKAFRGQWQLSVSGLESTALERLAQELDQPVTIESKNYSHKITLADQSQALKWLKALNQQGVVINEFKELKDQYIDRLVALY